MEMKAKQRREKRWTRRGRLLSLFGYMPPRTCMSLLRCPEKRRRGTEGWGKGHESGQRKCGQGGDVRYSFSLSHIGLLSLLRCPEWSEKKEKRKRKRRVKSRENEKYNRKLAFVRRVVAKRNTETKINREKMGKARTSPG